ncbi:hypothetical protein [Microseira sp. BLCC-F43]|jgi:hypothetical protein|uniref:hypothetical protein n=1 Tax=Microseira sp. BLCC-F43 TaxID=3153602 RepID=UPI0035B8C5A4
MRSRCTYLTKLRCSRLRLAVYNLANSIWSAREYFADSNEGWQRELLLGRRRILKSDIHEVETGFIEETRFLLCIGQVMKSIFMEQLIEQGAAKLSG